MNKLKLHSVIFFILKIIARLNFISMIFKGSMGTSRNCQSKIQTG